MTLTAFSGPLTKKITWNKWCFRFFSGECYNEYHFRGPPYIRSIYSAYKRENGGERPIFSEYTITRITLYSWFIFKEKKVFTLDLSTIYCTTVFSKKLISEVGEKEKVSCFIGESRWKGPLRDIFVEAKRHFFCPRAQLFLSFILSCSTNWNTRLLWPTSFAWALIHISFALKITCNMK